MCVCVFLFYFQFNVFYEEILLTLTLLNKSIEPGGNLATSPLFQQQKQQKIMAHESRNPKIHFDGINGGKLSDIELNENGLKLEQQTSLIFNFIRVCQFEWISMLLSMKYTCCVCVWFSKSSLTEIERAREKAGVAWNLYENTFVYQFNFIYTLNAKQNGTNVIISLLVVCEIARKPIQSHTHTLI